MRLFMYAKTLRRYWQLVLDCIFPIRCVGGCGRYDRWLCDDCRKRIGPIPQPECPVCRRPQASYLTCPDCSHKTSLAGLFVRADYQQPLIQTCVHALKYRFIEELGVSLGQEIASAIQKPVVIPIPLHWQRKNERGFNQAETIARAFGQALDWPVRTDILSRAYYTSPQAQLARAERLANLTAAIRVKRGVVISGQTVILIDDVATTLATLEACAQTLRKAGAGKVWGVVFARSKQ